MKEKNKEIATFKIAQELGGLVQVMDNGPGIDANLRDTLFYPMTTNKEGGSGLGLSTPFLHERAYLGEGKTLQAAAIIA